MAQNKDTSIVNANQLLQQKQYHEAINNYLPLVSEGYESLTLFYNLGIAYFESGQFPESILYFEKALKLDPKNEAAKHNLELANKKIDQEFIALKSFFLYRWWKQIVLKFSLGTWTFLVISTLFLVIASFFFYLFGKDIFYRKWGMRIFYPLCLIFILFMMASWSRYHFRIDQNRAIVLQKIELFNGPDQRSEKMYDLTPGSSFTILDSLDGWYKVELINKEYGWVKDEGFERI